MSINTPIVFFVFNRPELTRAVLEIIINATPSKVFIIADSPRKNKLDDYDKCREVLNIIDSADWNCPVFKNYSRTNLGCKLRISSGLDWVFSQVEEAIILEDDCLPNPSFFVFCEELLNKYRDDERIFTISGNNFQFGKKRTNHSYYFSLYNHCWGWATWRRAWQHYDIEMRLWKTIRDGNWLNDILHNYFASIYWRYKFQQTYDGKVDTWDYQWTMACWLQNGLTILPNINLVANIGFNDKESTHTKNQNSPFANIPVETMQFPLSHPPFIISDTKADNFTYRIMFGFWSRIYRKIREKIGI